MCRAEDKTDTQNNETVHKTEKVISALRPVLCGDNLTTNSFLIEVFLAYHLAITVNLTRTTKRQNTYKGKLTLTKSIPNKKQKTLSKTCAKTERGQSEPGLVAFLRQPGNGAGLFFQHLSLHGAKADEDLFCNMYRPQQCHLLHPVLSLDYLRDRGYSYNLPDYSTNTRNSSWYVHCISLFEGYVYYIRLH